LASSGRTDLWVLESEVEGRLRIFAKGRAIRWGALVERRAALGLLAHLALGCVPLAEGAAGGRPPGAPRPLVVLIAVDGVSWQDVFLGADPRKLGGRPVVAREELVPQLMQMEENGAVWGAPEGAGFHASGPNFISLPGYMEMLSGSGNTGCFTNNCGPAKRPSLLDEFAESRGAHAASAAAFASWSKVEFAASSRRSGIVSAGRSSGHNLSDLRHFPRAWEALSRGRAAYGMEGADRDFRPDAWTAELAYNFLTEAEPDFLFVSLGETDEWAHLGDYPKYLEALRASDRFVGRVRRYLRSSDRETALFVTTDHGRSHGFRDHGGQHPESSRGFLFAEGSRIRARGPIPAERDGYLRDIAPTVRALAGLRPRGDRHQGRTLVELFA
jgi:hypothetical protein